MAEEASAALLQAGVALRDIRFVRRADMRYVGQAYELELPIAAPLTRAFFHRLDGAAALGAAGTAFFA